MDELLEFVKQLLDQDSECNCKENLQDQIILNALHQTRVRLNLWPLTVIESVNSDWTISRKIFNGPKYVSSDAQIMDFNHFPSATPDNEIVKIDYFNGVYEYTTDRTGGVLINGWQYDPYRTASDLIPLVIMKLRNSVDFQDSTIKITASQKIKNLELMRKLYLQQAKPQSINLFRGDTYGL